MLTLTKKKLNNVSVLKERTSSAITAYKAHLSAESRLNKNFALVYKGEDFFNYLNRNTGFLIFARILFPKHDERLEGFLSELRTNSLNYLLIKEEDFRIKLDENPEYSWLVNYSGEGALLAIMLDIEEEYRNVLSKLINLEALTSEGIFNRIELSFVKEGSLLVSFKKQNSELRKLYNLNNTKRFILLETLSVLENPARTVAVTLNNEIEALGSAMYPASLLFSFPFKS